MTRLNRRSVMTIVLGMAIGLANGNCSSSASKGGGTGGASSGSGGASGTGGSADAGADSHQDAGTGGVASPPASGGATGSGGATATGSGGSVSTGSGGERASGSGGAPASSGGATAGAPGGTMTGGAGGHASTGNGGAGGRGGTGGAGGAGRGSGGAGGRDGSGSSCSGAALAAGNSNRTIQIGGVSRSYILHVPSGYTGTKAVPLVLDFHALGGSGSQEQSSSGYQAIADKQGFIILFPDGIDNAWNIGPCCTNSRDVDDLGFAKGMVTAVEAQACIDTKRVYATGFSMGGGMSQYLACNAADVFAAVAPSSFDLLIPDEEPCAPSRPISVLAYRGTADTTVPYAGGLGPSGKITFLGAQGSFQRWTSIDGCTGAATMDGDCTYQVTCDSGVEVGLCVKQGGGHAPGDANVGWAFLSRFSLP